MSEMSVDEELAALRLSVVRIAQSMNIQDLMVDEEGLSERCHNVNQRGFNRLCAKIVQVVEECKSSRTQYFDQ
jgi:hypothetical protein